MNGPPSNGPDGLDPGTTLVTDRRRFLQAAGMGAAGIAAVGDVASARLDAGTTIELEAVTTSTEGGRGRGEAARADGRNSTVSGPPTAVCAAIGDGHVWRGVAPTAIADEVNPTLSLTAGETYTVEWTNKDGDTHDFTIVDDGGAELLSTDAASTADETVSVTFEATEDMAAYYCSTHPGSQAGSVDVGQSRSVDVDRIAADPTKLPGPIDRSTQKHHEVVLTAEEHVAEIEDGVTFPFMTFGGRVPGPMIRVRRGDTVSFTLENATESAALHNIDFHAVYGTGGGAEATNVAPGESAGVDFRALYPGAFIYHCAVPNLDYHISSGMFGMILVEPESGLPPVDRELYLGQHEVYTDSQPGESGHHSFDFGAMHREEPTYVLFNGEKYPFTDGRYGPIEVDRGERVRVFMVCGGPNYSSNFHPIGNVWSRAYRDGGLPDDGSLAAAAEQNVQTMTVPPGSCMIGEMETPVPERIKLVDHALTRVTRRGLLAEIEVRGEDQPDIFDPNPGGSGSGDDGPY